MRIPIYRRALLIALSMLFASVAPAAPRASATLPPQITFDDALRIFRERGFDLLLAELSVASAEGDVSVAGAIYNPQVGVTYSHTSTYNPNDPSRAQSNATVRQMDSAST